MNRHRFAAQAILGHVDLLGLPQRLATQLDNCRSHGHGYIPNSGSLSFFEPLSDVREHPARRVVRPLPFRAGKAGRAWRRSGRGSSAIGMIAALTAIAMTANRRLVLIEGGSLLLGLSALVA